MLTISCSIIFAFFLLIAVKTGAQEWIRIYADTANVLVYNVYEHYDYGYILTGKRSEGWNSYGCIMKTDINGFKRWSKSYGIPGKMNSISSSRLANDGGIIAIGGTNNLSSSCKDPIIFKINSCGEKEWCKIYNAPGCDGYGIDIEPTPNGGYMALIDRWKTGEEQRIWLFRLDDLGEVIWIQEYATDTSFSSEWPHSLLMTTDSSFVITSEAYYPDPTYPNKWIIKIILIKVDLNGEAIFEVPWGTNNGIYSDGWLSIIDTKNNIYTAGRRARKTAPYGDSPSLFKTSVTGEPVFYKDLKTATIAGISTTVNWFQDSSLVFCSQWRDTSGIDTTGAIKTDSLGDELNKIVFPDNYGITGSDITFNNRLILGGSGYSSGYIFGCAIKLTSNLEFDSIYTNPFTYDSLCPYQIVSDTILLDDCEVIVDINDPIGHPEKSKLRVYPNPASEQMKVEMPKYFERLTSGFGLSIMTIYHQWKEARLEVFDLFGRLVYSEEIPQHEKIVTLDLSGWPGGMYVARIVFMNDVVGSAKFIVN